MTVAEYIFDFLSKKGVTMAFMVSGSSAMWLTDALKRNACYDVICNHHEQVCAMSAEVYYRTSGCAAVCLVTVGPGATNAITGVAGAYMDSTPLVVLSGQASSSMVSLAQASGVRQMGTQSLLLSDMLTPITKYFACVMDAADIRFHMEKAWHEAHQGRPGPVWLDIPVDIQNKKLVEDMKGFTPVSPQVFDKAFDFATITKWLIDAERPLILAGHGVRLAKAAEALLSFAETHNIPIVTSRLGIDLIPSTHELYVGRPGAYGDRASHYAIQNCDFLLCIGSRLAVSCIGYDGKKIAVKAKKVIVDIDPAEVDKDYLPADAKFEMDAGQFLSEMSQKLNNAVVGHHLEWIARCANWKRTYSIVQPEYENALPLNSYYVVDEISKRTAPSTDIIVDTGTSSNVVSQTWYLKKGQKYVISGGFSCMGYWAGAIGAAFANRQNGRQTLAFTGDGSFQMNVQDLATIRYYDLPIKIFVFENNGYLLIRLNQHNYMDDRFLGVGPDSGVGMPDIIAVARAYGISAFEISSKEELFVQLDKVFAHNGPVVCVIHTDPLQEMTPRMASKVLQDGSLRASAFEDLCPFLEEEEHRMNMY